MPSTNRQSVENKRYTMAELYELRRVIIKHPRSISPGPARNEHRQIAASMRSLIATGIGWPSILWTVLSEAALAAGYCGLC